MGMISHAVRQRCCKLGDSWRDGAVCAVRGFTMPYEIRRGDCAPGNEGRYEPSQPRTTTTHLHESRN